MLRAIGHEVRSPAGAMKNTLAGICSGHHGSTRRGGASFCRRRTNPRTGFEPRGKSADHRKWRLATSNRRRSRWTALRVEGVMGVIAIATPNVRCGRDDLRDVYPCVLRARARGSSPDQSHQQRARYTSVLCRSRRAQRRAAGWRYGADRARLPAGSLGLFREDRQPGANRSQGGLGRSISLPLVVERVSGGSGWLRAIARQTVQVHVPAVSVSAGKTRTGESVTPVGSGSTQRPATPPIINRPRW